MIAITYVFLFSAFPATVLAHRFATGKCLFSTVNFQNNINFELVAPPNTFSISQGACGSYSSTARLAQVQSAAAHLMNMKTRSEENEADNLIVTGDCAHLLTRRPDANPKVDSVYVFMNLKSARVCNFKFNLLD
jgi:hypothetical protein